jgi:hypothetical protein
MHPVNPKPEVAKPTYLVQLLPTVEAAFELLQREFKVGPRYVLDLSKIDAVDGVLREQTDVAALSQRKLQALRFAILPGVPTATDVIVGLVAELNRALPELSAVLPPAQETRLLGMLDLMIDAANGVSQIAVEGYEDDIIVLL